ncbi:PLP-dependent aminotransferase family protein [Streptomyces sp. NPDC048251]|uniref:aminotransferase-like domain-containing protein n=1 Tax=Streptomyces sp. NPDC048251 TaxID=3154501 RepID=UPI00343E7B5C
MVRLDYGLPDPAAFPAGPLAEAAGRVLRQPESAAVALSYGDPLGNREAIAKLIDSLYAEDIDPKATVFTTNGAMEALELVCMALFEPGDVLLVEQTTFAGVLPVARAAGAMIIGVPADLDGIDVDAAEQIIDAVSASGRRVRALYQVPTSANPTGTCLPIGRRQRLAALAERTGFILIEDDAYRDIFFSGSAPATLHRLAPDHVVHIRTLSKVLAPGLRLAVVAAPLWLAKAILALKPVGGTAPLVTEIVSAMLDDFDIGLHRAALRVRYGDRRDALAEQLANHLAPACRWAVPSGGFFMWIKLPGAVNPAKVCSNCAAAGVMVLPGSLFSVNGQVTEALRVSYSFEPTDRLAAAARQLADAVSAAMNEVVVSRDAAGTPADSPAPGSDTFS